MDRRFMLLIIVIGFLLVLGGLTYMKTGKEEQASTCGNGICEPLESPENCCIDCPCPSGYICQNNKCERISVQTSICGNGICEEKENCFDCPKDCKCSEGEYCSNETKKCVKPTCGNGICEPLESPENCCIDCPCLSVNRFCNTTTKSCQMYEMKLSDNEIKNIVFEYLKKKKNLIPPASNLTVTIEPFPQNLNGTIGKVVRVYNSEIFLTLFVTESGEVMEIHLK